MADVRAKEPDTVGKVVVHTTHGDLDIELWSKECPKACRNFVQLCMEGYYNNLIFHRLLPGFLIQGGCKKGTGETCESIYDAPYPLERNGRLQFRHRGMVGVANAGKGTDTNGSQFFITLARADFLNNSHTLFAKVGGATMYNLALLGELEADKADRPVDPPMIKRTEVVWNPFDDIAPRWVALADDGAPVGKKNDQKKERKPIEAVKNKKILSFGNESDEDGVVAEDAAKLGRVMSAHDALGGRLSSQTAYDTNELTNASQTRVESQKNAVKVPKKRDSTLLRSPSRSSSVATGSSASASSRGKAPPLDRSAVRQRARQADIEQLRAEIQDVTGGNGDRSAKKEKTKKTSELQQRNERYAQLKRGKKKEGGTMQDRRGLEKNKDKEAMDVLSGLAKRLRQQQAKSAPKDEDPKRSKKEAKGGKNGDGETEKAEAGTFAEIFDAYADEDDDDLTDWCASKLKFHVSADRAYNLDQARAKQALESFDPLKAKMGPSEIQASRKRMRDVVAESKAKKAGGALERP